MNDCNANVFSSEPFLAALAAAWYPGAVPGLARASSLVVKTLIHEGKPIGVHPLIDFFEPVPTTGGDRRDQPRVYLPRVSRALLSAESWVNHPLRSRGLCAPTVTWSRFADWADFEHQVAARRSKIWSDSHRQERRIAKDVGPLRVIEEPAPDDIDDIFALCLQWKSAQYARLGVSDLFADDRNTDVLRSLVDRGVGRVAGMFAGDRLVAAHVGLAHGKRFHSWFPSYDVEFERYSAGRLLLHRMLESSCARGDTEFDFLWGDEPYKWHYATDARLIEEAGRPPISVGLRRVARVTRDRAVRARSRGLQLKSEAQGKP